jgi:four helix bundle protein
MVLRFEELRVLQSAEAVADGIWRRVVRWEAFARDTVGKQMARAADSIGANMAEAYGRFHYGEKLQFLYDAHGSLFEAKYWLNRAEARGLVPLADAADYAAELTGLARPLDSFAADLKHQRHGSKSQQMAGRESVAEYTADPGLPLFSTEDLESLVSGSNT